MFANDLKAIPPDARAVIKKFDVAAEGILRCWCNNLITKIGSPMTLYHYTGDDGLKGVLESGALWLTDVLDFNDPSELRHGVSVAADIIRKKTEHGPPETKQFSAIFDDFATGGGIEASGHYFACCFSARGDDLGQWRAYADNGRGFALEFEADPLVRSFASGEKSTFPITYDDDALSTIHTQLIECAYPHFSLPRSVRMTKDEIRGFMILLSARLSMRILQAALYFKHEAYANETEFRFLEVLRGDQSSARLKFRSRPYALLRHREFSWRDPIRDSLRRIVIGPAADKIASEKFARNCLRAFHPKSETIEICCSKIPYRAQ